MLLDIHCDYVIFDTTTKKYIGLDDRFTGRSSADNARVFTAFSVNNWITNRPTHITNKMKIVKLDN